MCGIVGLYSPLSKNKSIILKNMLSSLHYRGPDSYGAFYDTKVGIASARLSIIDIDGGNQPMSNDNVFIVFNGEIFNYLSLKKELSQEFKFYNKSDTEVLLNAYLKYGPNFIKKVNGQFAIAIYDKKKSKLYLYRDRMGIKPLFFYYDKNNFIFGSEIKSLFATNLIERKLNPIGVDQIFTFWTMVNSTTMFQNIKQVDPSTYLCFDLKTNKSITNTYWEWPFPSLESSIKYNTETMYFEAFSEALESSVNMRMQADVDVGTYVSGGIDSSVITYIAKQNMSSLKSYSVGFNSKSFDESKEQMIVSRHIGTNHNNIYCANEDINMNFEDVIWHSEQTLFRTAPTPLFLLSRLVKKNNTKVILTGEGADEILLGYNIFKETIIRKFWSKFPDSKLRPLLLKKLYSYLPQYSNNRYSNLIYEFYKNTLNVDTFSYGHLVRWGNNTKNKIYYSDDMKNHIQNYNAIDDFRSQMPKRFFDASIIDQTQYIEVQTLLKGYLLSSQADRMLMANSVEGRFPYLDHNFIEFASKLPQNMKLKGMKDKYILRKSYDQHLPSQILNREKIAYQAPDIRGFIQNGKISDIIQENLNNEKINSLGFFNQKKISSLINRVSNSNSERTSTRDNQAFVQMLSTQLVKKIFIDEFEKNLKNRSVNINMKVIKSHSNGKNIYL